MFLSVIVPAYNAEKYIVRNLQSVYKQKTEDIEIIVINDGSTDSTLNLVETFIQEHKDIECKVVSIPNGGLANARNVGLENANGEYFINLDADDFLKEGILDKIKQKYNEEKFDICMYGFEEFNETKNIFENPYESQFNYIQGKICGELACLKKLKKEIWICQGNACYRRKMIIENNIFNVPGINQGEDFYFTFRALACAKSVVAIPNIGVSISYREDSMMHSKYNKSHLEIFKALDLLERDISNYNFLKNKEEIILFIHNEIEIQRLAVAKKIINSYKLIYAKKICDLMKKDIPQRNRINKLHLNKQKTLESWMLNNIPLLYIVIVKIYYMGGK